MTIIVWVIICLLFALSLAGVFVPVIPDALLVWGAFLLYQFGIGHPGLPWYFWVPMTLLTLLLIGADMLSNMYFVKKYGGDKWTAASSIVGIIGGPLLLGVFLGPFAILVGPFLAVMLLELARRTKGKKALAIAFGTVLAFLSSAAAKIVIQLVMITWFIIQVA
ncbi:DUF456 family protein [Aneurinibacillus sp. Ricciae_BoGa-3]|uniref:DUF456 domain-containing protein n=1 Tax=Aneurinibacillus sp. Ricciae_BoGa-3 TaxID=3022697 RepID=UPI002341A600|nr:DUF456 family protein [Aneurinibacillus sp. Ricciae_BoGa-3]WCK52380.1 DUF456 family protein [Aneurinibacillus sp. Ricciae_BoGa-3]